VLDKIQFLCSKIKRQEWSGILLYTVQGSMKAKKGVTLICQDIILMDKGSAGYTEFDWDEIFVNYKMDNPHAMGWSAGQIHSHNTMSVFFSPTDMSELNDNCPNHNIYLSLIVNNYMEMEAKVAYTAEPKKFICKDETGKDYELALSTSSITPFMFVHECDIKAEARVVAVEDSFEARYKEIEDKYEAAKKKKEAEEAEKKKTQALAQKSYSHPAWQSKNGKTATPWKVGPNTTLHKEWEDIQAGFDAFNQPIPKEAIFKQSLNSFTCYILRLGYVVPDDSVLRCLEVITTSDLSLGSLVDKIIANFDDMYTEFYHDSPEHSTDDDYFETIEEVIQRLNEQMAFSPFEFLKTLIPALDAFLISERTALEEQGIPEIANQIV